MISITLVTKESDDENSNQSGESSKSDDKEKEESKGEPDSYADKTYVMINLKY